MSGRLGCLCLGLAIGCSREAPTDETYASPELTLTSPSPGSELRADEEVVIEAILVDTDTPIEELALTFSSDVNGMLAGDVQWSGGHLAFTGPILSVGGHVLSVTATDPEGNAVLQQVGVQVVTPETVDTDGADTDDTDSEDTEDTSDTGGSDTDVVDTDVTDTDDTADTGPMVDGDGDGHAPINEGGDDCNDGNNLIFPGATDACGDNIDQNCDGQDLACVAQHCGVISEDEVWESDVQHWVTCDVFVEGTLDPVLTIENGADVRFWNTTHLFVGLNDGGSLQISVGNQVTFSAYDIVWDGVFVGEFGDIDVNNWRLEGANNPLSFGSATGTVDNLTIEGSLNACVNATNSDVRLWNTTLQNCGTEGIKASDSQLDLWVNIQDPGGTGFECAGTCFSEANPDVSIDVEGAGDAAIRLASAEDLSCLAGNRDSTPPMPTMRWLFAIQGSCKGERQRCWLPETGGGTIQGSPCVLSIRSPSKAMERLRPRSDRALRWSLRPAPGFNWAPRMLGFVSTLGGSPRCCGVILRPSGT